MPLGGWERGLARDTDLPLCWVTGGLARPQTAQDDSDVRGLEAPAIYLSVPGGEDPGHMAHSEGLNDERGLVGRTVRHFQVSTRCWPTAAFP